jgi:uncharacterized YigZ family protein
VRERGSRFLGILLPVADEEEAGRRLADLRRRYPDASHHCWAYRIGWPARERSSDAGEPSGTAGVPMLRVLAGRGLSDVLVVVVRWFGGTKLGKGGLARAYGGTTRETIEAARLVERFPTVALDLEVPYELLGAVRRLLRPPEVELEAEKYEEKIRLTLRVAESVQAGVEEDLAALGLVAKGA